MCFYPIELKTNYMASEYAVAGSPKPRFSWGAVHDGKGLYQSEYRICVYCEEKLLWDSGFIKSEKMNAIYDGEMLRSGAEHTWTLELKDSKGEKSTIGYGKFKTGLFDEWEGEWICSPNEKNNEAIYFVKCFEITEKPMRAVLYHCGLGIDKAYINGNETENYRLQPAFTNYPKLCEYTIDIIEPEMIKAGKNYIGIIVAGGWRKNYGAYLDNLSENRKIEFMGDMCLNAQLVLYYADGRKEVVKTDTSWQCTDGAITQAHLFDGEVYDEYKEKKYWNTKINEYDYSYAELSDFKTEKLKACSLEPICIKREIKPINSYSVNGVRIYDFGENISGVLKIKINGVCRSKTSFKMKHAELTDEHGMLYTAPLRGAKSTDCYICRSGECCIDYAPEFTYHGFRYASLEIDGDFDGTIEATAIVFYTDIDTEAYFRCSDMTVNEIYNFIMRTERSNLHSVATDCPQRDERMGWLNDATVRFTALPYNFNVASLFKKIATDISNEQDNMGRITCTAPFVYGERPADPVCSSYLLTAWEYYLSTGSIDVIEKNYSRFVKWNEYLASRREDGIVNYSYYGDWAGPADCCYSVDTIGNSDKKKLEEYDTDAANSKYIPGIMISTGCHYMNYMLLMKFAELTGKHQDVKRFAAEADLVKRAFIDKWVNMETGEVYNASQACQAFALYIGILPENICSKAAELMNIAVVDVGCRLQTGNITTPMLMNSLGKYGYINTAWKLLTRTEYPSWGYMLANGATTVWERFELKKNSGMNSHNHPMYGAVLSWFYEVLAGFEVITPCAEYYLSPQMPEEMNFFEMKIPIINGMIYIKCEKKYGKTIIYVNVPFGIKLNVNINEKKILLKSGFHTFEY